MIQNSDAKWTYQWTPLSTSWTPFQLSLSLRNCLNLKLTKYMISQAISRGAGIETNNTK
jgi:hypothetical protein